MQITCLDKSMVFPEPCTVLDCLSAMGILNTGILAVMAGSRLMELGDTLESDAELQPITFADSEGRRIYERSLRFVMLMALKTRYPGERVRVEYSVAGGILVRMPNHALSSRDVRQIESDMRAICQLDMPFTHETWSTEKAIAYFTADGQQDKVDLLHYRRLQTIRMYHCGQMYEYFYGAMAPSTGYVSVFDVLLHGNGFVLSLPSVAEPDSPAPYIERPRHLAVFDQSAHWCSILGVENVSDLAHLMEKHRLREFIRVNEALHDQAMIDTARTISEGRKRIVLIAGPSSSGKTTFAGKLAIQLRVLGHRAIRVSLDNYYRNRAEIPLEPDGSVDLEHIRAIDVPLIQQQALQLLQGEEVQLPVYSFKTKNREEQGIPLQLGPDDILIFEGIHALNPELSRGVPQDAIHRIFVSALTCLNLDDHNRIRTTDVRLLRRIVRDHQFRGVEPSETLGMWESVRRGEETWIFPYQEMADTVFNTALHYELPVLAHFSRGVFSSLTPSMPGYLLALRLKKMLNYVPEIDPAILDEIPPLSLLREFIGGSTIDEE